MSFSFEFEVSPEGELVQNEQQAANLKNAVQYGNVPVGKKFFVNGHKPTGPEDWGGSLGVSCEGIGGTNMSSTFLKPTAE